MEEKKQGFNPAAQKTLEWAFVLFLMAFMILLVVWIAMAIIS